MNAAEAQQAADHLSKGVNVFFFGLMLIAAAVVVVRAFRGERPTKEMWDAVILGGLAVFSVLPSVIPHSKVPALVGMIVLIGVGLWRFVWSRRPRK